MTVYQISTMLCLYAPTEVHLERMPTKRAMTSPSARFESKIVIQSDTGCHVWTGARDLNGYAQFKFGGRCWLGHVWIWVRKRGEIPEGQEIDHVCRNTSCVNIDHLELVTRAENMRRRKIAQATLKSRDGDDDVPDRTLRDRRKKISDDKVATAALHLRPLKAAIWYALLGETKSAAESAAKIATAGDKGVTDAELKALVKAAKGDVYEDARAGTNAYNARLTQYALMLWLVRAIESAALAPAQNVPFGVKQLQAVLAGFGGSLAGFKEVRLDLVELLHGISGDDLSLLVSELQRAA